MIGVAGILAGLLVVAAALGVVASLWQRGGPASWWLASACACCGLVGTGLYLQSRAATSERSANMRDELAQFVALRPVRLESSAQLPVGLTLRVPCGELTASGDPCGQAGATWKEADEDLQRIINGLRIEFFPVQRPTRDATMRYRVADMTFTRGRVIDEAVVVDARGLARFDEGTVPFIDAEGAVVRATSTCRGCVVTRVAVTAGERVFCADGIRPSGAGAHEGRLRRCGAR